MYRSSLVVTGPFHTDANDKDLLVVTGHITLAKGCAHFAKIMTFFT